MDVLHACRPGPGGLRPYGGAVSFDLNAALNGEPDVVISSDALVQEGVVRPCRDTAPNFSRLGGSPISYISTNLWEALDHELPLDLFWASTAARETAVYGMLRLLTNQARDVASQSGAEEGTPEDDLYTVEWGGLIDHGEVWFKRNGPGGPITACLPDDI
jgi:hypothetical protein